jgi:broad-specificity NMP kinase
MQEQPFFALTECVKRWSVLVEAHLTSYMPKVNFVLLLSSHRSILLNRLLREEKYSKQRANT